jgi:hypothetical protein
MRTRGLGCSLMISMIPACLAASVAPVPGTPKVSPEVLEMGAFYSGPQVKVEGVAENGAKVIITVSGQEGKERFNVKGRVGPIWLNSGKVHVSGAPSLFLRFSAAPVTELLPTSQILGRFLDERSQMSRMGIEPSAGSQEDRLRASFLALKRERKTYQFLNDGVIMGSPGSAGTPYSTIFTWPRSAVPASYTVTVYEVRGGAVLRQMSVPLRVVRVGFPAWLAGTAERNASLYGLTAVIVGAIAGFGIDFITTLLFGKKRSVAH